MGESGNRRILITGALGQIGMELLDALQTKFGSENVIASDIRESEDVDNSGFRYEKLDVLDSERMESIIRDNNINEVDIEEHAPNVVLGVKLLADWFKKN